MFTDVKPSHLLLIFLSGALAVALFAPPVVYILDPQAEAGHLFDVYQRTFTSFGQAGTGGTIIGLGVIFFTGILVDALNIISHRKRHYSAVKRFLARRWGYGEKLEFLLTNPGLRSQWNRPSEKDKEYAQAMLRLRQKDLQAQQRGWEWFQSQAFTLLVLEMRLLFWTLLVVIGIHWAATDVLTVQDFIWPALAAIAYCLLIPAEIHHRYARALLEEALKEMGETAPEGEGASV